jgi:hypothetical protein
MGMITEEKSRNAKELSALPAISAAEDEDLDPYLDSHFDSEEEGADEEPELIRGSLSWGAAKYDHEQNYLDGE